MDVQRIVRHDVANVFMKTESFKVGPDLASDHSNHLRLGLVTAINDRAQLLSWTHANSDVFIGQQSLGDVPKPRFFWAGFIRHCFSPSEPQG